SASSIPVPASTPRLRAGPCEGVQARGGAAPTPFGSQGPRPSSPYSREGQRGLDAPRHRRGTAQAHRQLGWIGQGKRANDLELFDVDVDAMEAGEEHEPVGAGCVQAFREGAEG